MAEQAAVEPALERQDNGAELDPLFAEQDELLREAEQMGYEAVTLLAASGNLPAEPSVAPPSVPVMAEPEPIAQAEVVADTDTVPSTVSSMQSLLGKRNLLRSRLRSEPSAATSAARTAPAKPVAAARPATAIQPAATPAPAFDPQPVRVDGQGQASARPAPQTGYDDLPPLDAYEESGSDYEEYLSQGFSDAFASAPLPERAAQATSPASIPAAVTRPQSDDLPPWDLDGSAPRQVSAAPVAVPVTASREVVVSEPAPAVSVMETIDWDELEGDSQPQAGEVAARLIPSSLLNSCGDPWAELIARTGVGGRLRQLAINSVMSQQGDKVLLTLKPEQRHLISDRARADLAEIIGPELGQPVQVEVTLGSVSEQETPLEIEHRLYLGVREQVTRDLEQDPNVQFLQQRFGAVLHHDSIEPLSR